MTGAFKKRVRSFRSFPSFTLFFCFELSAVYNLRSAAKRRCGFPLSRTADEVRLYVSVKRLLFIHSIHSDLRI